MSYFKALERSKKRKLEEQRKMEEQKTPTPDSGTSILKIVPKSEEQNAEELEKAQAEALRKSEEQKALLQGRNKPLIVVCIPHKETFYARFVTHTLIPLLQPWSPEVWCDKGLITTPGHNVDVQREKLVEDALANGATHVFFIDSDMLFDGVTPNQGLKMLYDMDVPIASGIARMRKGELGNFQYAMFKEVPPNSGKYCPPTEEFVSMMSTLESVKTNAGNIMSIGSTGLVDSVLDFHPDVVGMFCCLIKKEVFEKLPRPWFKWAYEKGENLGEDWYFCKEAGKAGFKISVNPLVKLDHMGIFAISVDLQVKGFPTG